MTRPYQLPVSRPAWPHFEDAPEAELEEERAAFADWKRDQGYGSDRVPGDDQDECEIVAMLRVVRR